MLLPLNLEIKAAWPEPVRARNAIVAAQHPLASQIGADVMKRGGNAVDAAIAVAVALAVTYPKPAIWRRFLMLIRFKDGRTTAIDYREMAPKAANRDIFIDKDGNLIRGEGGSQVGYRAAGVPGTPAGLEYAFKKYGSGKIKWAELIAELARLLAQNGYVLSNRLANLFLAINRAFQKYDDSKRIFLNGGNYFREGDKLVQTDLAQTLLRIQKYGAKGFYEGKTAQLIADDMKAHNGLITLEDLKNYKVRERVPLRGSYRGKRNHHDAAAKFWKGS